jgi:hypothetical protein
VNCSRRISCDRSCSKRSNGQRRRPDSGKVLGRLERLRKHVSFAHDIRCDSNIIGNASPDQILPSDFARCMLERVNMTLPARIRPNENQIACDKRVAVETCLIAVLFDVVAPVDTPSVAIQGIEIPEQDPTNSNLPTTVAEENTQPCVSNCQRIAGSDWSAFTLPKAITNSAIGRAVRPDRAEPPVRLSTSLSII